MDERTRSRGFIALFALTYMISARLGLLLEPVSGFATPVWPPSGIAMFGAMVAGRKIWPVIAGSAALVNLSIGAPLTVSLAIGVGNGLEAGLGTAMIRFASRAPARRAVTSVAGVFALVGLGAGVATLISATIGVGGLTLAGLIPRDTFFTAWRTWWVGDVMGVLLVTPLLLAWFGPRAPGSLGPSRGRALESVALAVGLLATVLLVFARPGGATRPSFESAYLVFPCVLWAAFRFGVRGATSATLTVAFAATFCAWLGLGPFVAPAARDSIFSVQLFMGVVALTALILGAAMDELSRALGEARESERRAKSMAWDLSIVSENEKRAKEALLEAGKRKDQFLAVLAHELRNPLGPIRSALHVLRLEAPIEPSKERFRDIIDRQVRHLARLVDDLLDVSRITRGKISLQRRSLDLVELVRETVEDHRLTLEGAGIEVRVELPSEPLFVDGDATRLAQVMGNVLHNARKFCDPGGRVTVSLRRIGGVGVGQAQLSIADTGVGMDPSMVERAFDIFSQADQSLDRSRGGLGIGLALVKGLVELHGGTVLAKSAGLGRGSEFVVTLPLDPAGAREATDTAVPSGSAVPRRILVIEDNPDAAEALASLLEIMGHEVAVQMRGGPGIEAARRLRPDLVLCDLGLPDGVDGFAVARALRADAETRGIPLVALTGYGQEEDRARSREAGFDEHFTKPLELPALEHLLQTLPRRR